jgi:Cyclin-dependent kinase inhibitor 3 (CDKN3)
MTETETAERAAEPIGVDWVDLALVPGLRSAGAGGGRLGMTNLPGDRDPRPLGLGLPPRDLAADALGLHQAGVDALLLLVEDHELEHSEVPHMAEALAGQGIELLRFPIPDFGVTEDPDGLRSVLDGVASRVREGQTVVVACRAGRGRTGTVVGCLLRDGGLDADASIALTRSTRPGTIEREEQERFVRDWDRG